MRKDIFLYLKIILLFVIFFWIFKKVNISESIKLLTHIKLSCFFWAFVLSNLSHFLITIKWYRLANPLKIKSNFLDLLQLNYISTFYSIFIPGQFSGELIKGLKLTRKEASHQKVWVPIFIDKISNLFAIFFIGFIGVLTDKTFRENKSLLILVSFFTIILLFATIIIFSEKTNSLIRHIKKYIVKILHKLKVNIKFIDDFSLTYFENYKKHNLLIFETMLWSFSIKIPHVFAFYLLALSLGIGLNLIQSAWLFSIVSIVTILPVSFSGLGIREGTVLVLLSNIGTEPSKALSLSMLIFLVGVLTGLIGGIFELLHTVENKSKNR